MNKKKAEYVSIAKFLTKKHPLPQIVKLLQEYYENGENVYVEYNDHTLYSADNLTLEEAYKLMEFDKNQNFEEWKEKMENDTKKDIINKLINYGNSFIPKSKQATWAKMVNYSFENGYGESVINQIINIMEQISSGTTQDKIDEVLNSATTSGGAKETVIKYLYELLGIDVRQLPKQITHSTKDIGGRYN